MNLRRLPIVDEPTPLAKVSDDEIDDAALLDRFRAGDERAFDAIVHRHAEFVARLARRLLGNDDGVDDVAQDVFLQVYGNAAKFRGDSSFKTWLYAIAASVCRNRQRSLMRRLRIWIELTRQSPPESSTGDAAASDEQENSADRIRSTVAGLPASLREVVVLHYFEELSVEATAAALAITANAVSLRLHRARARLRDDLGPNWRM